MPFAGCLAKSGGLQVFEAVSTRTFLYASDPGACRDIVFLMLTRLSQSDLQSLGMTPSPTPATGRRTSLVSEERYTKKIFAAIRTWTYRVDDRRDAEIVLLYDARV